MVLTIRGSTGETNMVSTIIRFAASRQSLP